MSDTLSRVLLVAILAVSAANLMVSVIQTAILITRPAGTGSVAEAADRLPASFSPAELERLAKRVTTPYNRDDLDALYAEFDDVTKVQVTREKFHEQMGNVSEVVGHVDSWAFAGGRKIPNQGSLPTYQLNYVVRLSGGKFPGGTMTINAVDRGGRIGVIGFFVNGATR